MPDGAPYVSSRPAVKLNGTVNGDMGNSLLDIGCAPRKWAWRRPSCVW